jgi:hypothetical protein
MRLKVSEKGGVSVYGLGRFPVTLYKEQWLKLLDMADDIRAFIAANEAVLKANSKNNPRSRVGVRHWTSVQLDPEIKNSHSLGWNPRRAALREMLRPHAQAG